MRNFWEACKGDLSKLAKEKVSKRVLIYHNEEIQKQFYEEFASEETIKYAKGLKKIAVMMAKFLKTGDRTLLTFIEIEKQALGKTIPQTEVDTSKIVGQASKAAGFMINPAKISTYEFYALIKGLNG